MKGIVLAGGSGTRLSPLTIAVSKQLMPIYNKPMIYYPISTLIGAGIYEICIISTPEDQPKFRALLWDGSELGCVFTYAIQEIPNGLAQAFVIAEDFIGEDSVCLVLGDNLFHGIGFETLLSEQKDIRGGLIFAHKVNDPERYGVVEFNKEGEAISIEEKPKEPKSTYAVPWIYMYDNTVIEIAKSLIPSDRWEYEITDVNKVYLERWNLRVAKTTPGMGWFDTGTFDSLMQASQFVQILESRQGIRVGYIEEMAYRTGRISLAELHARASKYKKSEYGKYLLSLE